MSQRLAVSALKNGCVALSIGVLVGCVTTSQSSATMDEYDPRNNIPLLQAASKNMPSPAVSGPSNVPAKAPQPTSSNAMQKLRELKTLRDEGVLNQKEYEAKKADILKNY